jgi:hypothetical protein
MIQQKVNEVGGNTLNKNHLHDLRIQVKTDLEPVVVSIGDFDIEKMFGYVMEMGESLKY